ncbi:hypothetical protein [Mycobacteroides abscessus]|uniref:hypothetical protein n=1 Tax=Mycobacteroides abscessus TaxID=36809 RepID=UPI0010421B19|nr:hypothetical protein [Mycobacteroides abscessus]
MSDETRAWLTQCAETHPDPTQRSAALRLLLDLDEAHKVPPVSPWAVQSLLGAAGALRAHCSDADRLIAASLIHFTVQYRQPRWGRTNPVAYVPSAVVMGIAEVSDWRADERPPLRAQVGLDAGKKYPSRKPQFGFIEAMAAVEVALRYHTNYASAATLLAGVGVLPLARNRFYDGLDLEQRLLRAVPDDAEYGIRYRLTTALTYASVMRECECPVDTKWRRWALDNLCKSRPTIDEVVETLSDDTLELIEHFTVDGEPVTELLEAMLDLSDWARPLIGGE